MKRGESLGSEKIILLTTPSDCVEDDRLEPNLGLMYIASVARESGLENILIDDLTGCKSEHDIQQKISNISFANFYGISSFSTNYNYTKNMISQIRKINPTAGIILGGPHPSAYPEQVLEDSGANIVVKGEGEDAFLDAINIISKDSKAKMIIEGEGRNNIDSYPFPARDLVDDESYSRRFYGKKVAGVLTSRGCKHHCVHCNSVIMGGGNKKVRYRSSDNIVKEIAQLRDSFENIRFNDDHFTGNPNIEELLTWLKDYDIKYRVFARVEDLTKENCKLLYESGCKHISVGIESLNPDNLKSIGKNHQAGYEKNLFNAKEYDMIIRSSFMVGLPHDSDKAIDDAFGRAAELPIDEFAVYPLIPYPGTIIAKKPELFGYRIVNDDFTDYVQMGKSGTACYALEHENFTTKDVEKWKKRATAILEDAGIGHMSTSKVAN